MVYCLILNIEVRNKIFNGFANKIIDRAPNYSSPRLENVSCGLRKKFLIYNF